MIVFQKHLSKNVKVLPIPNAQCMGYKPYIWPKFMVNVGKYTIHGFYGNGTSYPKDIFHSGYPNTPSSRSNNVSENQGTINEEKHAKKTVVAAGIWYCRQICTHSIYICVYIHPQFIKKHCIYLDFNQLKNNSQRNLAISWDLQLLNSRHRVSDLPSWMIPKFDPSYMEADQIIHTCSMEGLCDLFVFNVS